jgi:monofunctional biosynthetic peptidoglycan transglycosylase
MAKKRKKSVWGKIWAFIWKLTLTLFVLSIVLTVLYRWVNPPITPLMVIRKVEHLGTPIEKSWRPLSEISPYMVDCAVAAEDNNFLGHHGFDVTAIQTAMEERESGKRKRGASTISQQTAKNVFLFPAQTWVRKGLEVYFTFLIETIWSKERIMEVYLNVIEMGNGIYGSEAAAQHYFNKSAAKLSRQQAALITATYPNPLDRNPARPTKYLKRRASKIADLSIKVGRTNFDKSTIKKVQKRYKKQEDKSIKKILK